jgi:hypothetical protein
MNNKYYLSTIESKNQTNKKSDEQNKLVNGIESGAWKWNRLTILRGSGVCVGGERLDKDLIYMYALPMNTDNRAVKAWGGVGTMWKGAMGVGGKEGHQ